MSKTSAHTYRAVLATATIFGAFLFITPARAAWFSWHVPATSLGDALKSVKASVESLANAEDAAATPGEKDRQEFKGKVQTMQKVIELGTLEVKDLHDRLLGLHIEELVADDFTFDAVETANTLRAMLQSFDGYYGNAQKRLLAAQNVADVKKIAADMRVWRETTYTPGVKKILSLESLLQNRASVKTASARFDKILTDLRKLKSAELISFTTIEPLITSAGASLKKAKALDEDATNIVFHLLKENAGMKSDAAENAIISPHERIANLLDQSLNELRDAYKTFIALNGGVKKMLGIE